MTDTKKLPDAAFVRECLDYDPISGSFIWRQRPHHHFPNIKAWRWWNAKFSGLPAGGNSDTGRQSYWRIHIGRIQFRAHRIAWLLTYGEPVPELIDHIDGDTLNNSIANLRAATCSENGFNQRLVVDSTSGIKGVRLQRRPGKSDRFIAYITAYRKNYWLGSFITLEEAVAARREAAERLHGHFHRHE